MSAVVDLNADLGEHDDWGSPAAAQEQRLLPLVTTAHVACGFHAGTRQSMRRVVEACLAAGVVVGAHPSYPDREGFGRRPLARRPAQIAEDVAVQLDSLAEVAAEAGTRVRSVKAHGALYHRMAADEEAAEAVVGAVVAFDPGVALVVPSAGAAGRVAAAAGLETVAEGFCDRAYRADGSLVPRGQQGALISQPDQVARQAVALATGDELPTADGGMVRVACQTLCLHGDSPGAVAMAATVREALGRAGVLIAPVAVSR